MTSRADTLYRNPEIYDVAFGWDLEMELDFVESCLRTHAPAPVRAILEPACGTGRILAALAVRGYEVAGYDVSPEMVAYATARLARSG
jgi:SAM-dependent methyltransferase